MPIQNITKRDDALNLNTKKLKSTIKNIVYSNKVQMRYWFIISIVPFVLVGICIGTTLTSYYLWLYLPLAIALIAIINLFFYRKKISYDLWQSKLGRENEMSSYKAQIHEIQTAGMVGFYSRAVSDLKALGQNAESPKLRNLANLSAAKLYFRNQQYLEALSILMAIEAREIPFKFDQKEYFQLLVKVLIRTNLCIDARIILHQKGVTYFGESFYYSQLSNTFLSDESFNLIRLELLNKILTNRNFSPISIKNDQSPLALGNIHVTNFSSNFSRYGEKLVTVIVPAYNAEKYIEYCISSLLVQVGVKVEVIVVNDSSSDRTASIVTKIAEKHNNVQVIHNLSNIGAYASRNIGVNSASGDFITVQDADDWSHPEKLVTQVNHLLENPDVLANYTDLFRVSDKLEILGEYGPNYSSLMFRSSRKFFWDEVRTSADDDLFRQIRAFSFGKFPMRIYEGVPLTLALSSSSSLTAQKRTGNYSLDHAQGMRRNYVWFGKHWLSKNPNSIPKISSLPSTRFTVPQSMRLESNIANDPTRFDIVYCTNISLPGGTSSQISAEIAALSKAGFRIGLVHHPTYYKGSNLQPNPKYFELIENGSVELITFDQIVQTNLLVFVLPTCFQVLLDEFVDITAKKTILLVNQTPNKVYGEKPIMAYDLDLVVSNIECLPGIEKIQIVPLSPIVRSIIEQHHLSAPVYSRLSERDWLIGIDIPSKTLSQKSKSSSSSISIGRHSRDSIEKWPLELPNLLGAYPSTPQFSVNILGGAKVPIELIGNKPKNWKVHNFGSMDPINFLSTLDYYVYFINENGVEAFGLAPLEALASGLVLITSKKFEPLFGAAAFYCNPVEVSDVIARLENQPSLKSKAKAEAYDLCRNKYSMERQVERITLRLMNNP